jgi:Fe-S-cluster-containing hydrogenase component 2
MSEQVAAPRCLAAADLELLFRALRERGLRVLGPTVRDQAVVLAELTSAAELPRGVGDLQAPGSYRLRERGDGAYFGFNAGPHTFKQHLFPPREPLLTIRRRERTQLVEPAPLPRERWALLGVKACDLAAIQVQDRVFMPAADAGFADPRYRARREHAFIIVTECTQAAATCFCVSMGTGPAARGGFDLALTEVLQADAHYFLCRAGSPAGAELLAALPTTPADSDQLRSAAAAVAPAAQQQRAIATAGIKEALYAAVNHPHWDDVASRCLSCSSCTLVCPTCFCSATSDSADLAATQAERARRWDSCFNLDHSYLHGGPVRGAVASRYRQWLTHKLASWIDQFGTSGCVGCGRCITFCPVGIDITRECAALRAPLAQATK